MAKKFVPIQLDKVRNLRLGMTALIQLEKKLGRPMASIDYDKIKYEEIAAILWAALLHEDKSLTIDKVAELIDEYSDIPTAIQAMGEAMTESFGKNELGTAQGKEEIVTQTGTGK